MPSQFIDLFFPEKLPAQGHLTGQGDPHRDFAGCVCWLRYEHDGFWVDYPNDLPSWHIVPTPKSPKLAYCTEQGEINIHTADGSGLKYDALRQMKIENLAPMASLSTDDEDIDMDERKAVAWVQSQNDPYLWHLAAMAAVANRGDTHGFLPWLIKQPNMDRATAGWIFLWAEGARYLQGETEFPGEGVSSSDMLEVMHQLCKRSEIMGFARDKIGLDPQFENERQACLSVINQGLLAQGITVPRAIIGHPFDAPKENPNYTLDDGIIIVE